MYTNFKYKVKVIKINRKTIQCEIEIEKFFTIFHIASGLLHMDEIQ